MAKKKYTVYLTATDEWLCEGTSKECSAELGITQGTFAWHASQCRQGSPSKYLIKEHKSNETMSKDEFVKRLSDQRKAKLKKDEIVIPEEKLVKREEEQTPIIDMEEVEKAVIEAVEEEIKKEDKIEAGQIFRDDKENVIIEVLMVKDGTCFAEVRSLTTISESALKCFRIIR